MAAKKQYGLIIPKGNAKSAFNIDSDEEEAAPGTDWVKESMKQIASKNNIKKKLQSTISKALEEDPTIYEYDEVYDDIQAKKIDAKAKTTEKERKPKYVQALLKSAENRKREQEWRIERQVQKEREQEGDMFADKESYVTSAYKKKMEELQELAEKEKRESQLEALTDVTKQSDMSGFYRQLYRQTVNKPSETETSETLPEKLEDASDLAEKARSAVRKNRQYRRRDSSSESEPPTPEPEPPAEVESEPDDFEIPVKNEVKKRMEMSPAKNREREQRHRSRSEDRKRSRRSRSRSRDRHHSRERRDSRRHRSRSRDNRRRRSRSRDRRDDRHHGSRSHSKREERRHRSRSHERQRKDRQKSNRHEKDKESRRHNEEASPPAAVQEKPINIWEKRTVGAVYEEARLRFLQRKAERGEMWAVVG